MKDAKRETATEKPESLASQAAYRAPALEKGLDILELLSGYSESLTLSQIAQSLGRSVQEVYRVIISLERRGYVARQPPNDTFKLTMKLFDLACNHPPLRRVMDAARPIMQQLADGVDQAIILSILDGAMIRVIAVADNPAPIGFRVRLGAQSPVLQTASGRTLLAFQSDGMRQNLLANLMPGLDASDSKVSALVERIEQVRDKGYEMVSGETLRGITDVSFPIVDNNGVAHCALTMPFLIWVQNKVGIEQATQQLFEGALALSREIGGTLQAPQFPLSE
ncbi:IclR family transcriptional regulator [Rhizobium sp. KVB221]|uniref:IclR family transcriptional regulator n=1 Tax=Rhizobium setariae TaxID=2801340 RepID=A0A936YS91_9HYPH|nr:IclR family transcriptional regulator [Rhizobium setariae]MBL0373309.1 IclR family transcriptional regulator [Rhizobium setariae]